MPTEPSPQPKSPGSRPLRQIRGYVQSYGQGRICSEPECDTTLSRYNTAKVCWRHEQQALRRR